MTAAARSGHTADPGRLVGVGVGPGDPDLVTIKAIKVLQAADLVFVPVSEGNGPYGPAPDAGSRSGAGPGGGCGPDAGNGSSSEAGSGSGGGSGSGSVGVSGGGGEAGAQGIGDGALLPGRAEATVRAHVTHDRIRRLPFRMTGAADYATPADAVVAALRAAPGRTVAFATIGDPNVYSTFTALATEVRARVPGVRIETVPGIMALQDLAARSGTVLAHGAETLAVLPLTAGVEAYRHAVDGFDTVVAYKGGRALPQVLAVLAAAGRIEGPTGEAVYGAALGLPGEDIRPAGTLPAAATGPYLSTVLATRRHRWPS